KKNETLQAKMVGIFKLFVYADWLDIILMIIGLIAAVVNGIGVTIRIIVLGKTVNTFIGINLSSMMNGSTSPAIPRFDVEAEMTKVVYYYVGLGFASMILSTIQVWTFLTSAARQTARIRQKAFFAILHQEMAWFDTTQIGTLNTRLTE
uniref:ABC transmembrane type-1 domain-containing protein n=1 Tax=Pelusios castaneus TaxID=367368 RepID=A0A8C8RK65_9SAUR